MKHFAFLLGAVLCCSGLRAQGPENGLTPFDVATLRTVYDVIPSPDGKTVLFTRSEPRLAGDGIGGNFVHLYRADILGALKPERLIGGAKSVRQPAWSPDGEYITFLDHREGAVGSQVYALPAKGGEAFQLSHLDRSILSYKWSPDGERMAFTVREPLPDVRVKARQQGFRPIFVDEGQPRIFLYHGTPAGKDLIPLVTRQSVVSFEWSPDSSTIIAALAPTSSVDDRYVGARLHSINVKTGEIRLAVDNPGKLGGYGLSPDGRHLAWIGAVDVHDPHAGMLHVTDMKTGRTDLITKEFPGMIHQALWQDNEHIVAVASYGVRTYVGALELATGRITPMVTDRNKPSGLAFRHVALVPGDPHSIVTAASHARYPAEAYRLRHGAPPTRLSWSNTWLDDYALGKQETWTFKARDGLPIEGLLLYPIHFTEGQRYPLVIVAHGGPESHFSEGWNTHYSTWGQLLCARGYFVWMPNYRSSTGYGVAFAKKDHGDPMGTEFNDHLDAIKELDKRGLIDPKRVGIGGGSYGGYTAAWAATRHSDHFAAAVSFVPFVHIRTKWYTSDIPQEFLKVHYEGKLPHLQKAFLDSRSPLEFAENCHTPLLVLGGDRDPRVHPSQPFMLYRAVKMATDTPVRYIQYSGEGHGNRINVNRFDYCLRTLRWFDHYLKKPNRRRAPLPPLDLDYSSWRRSRSH